MSWPRTASVTPCQDLSGLLFYLLSKNSFPGRFWLNQRGVRRDRNCISNLYENNSIHVEVFRNIYTIYIKNVNFWRRKMQWWFYGGKGGYFSMEIGDFTMKTIWDRVRYMLEVDTIQYLYVHQPRRNCQLWHRVYISYRCVSIVIIEHVKINKQKYFEIN